MRNPIRLFNNWIREAKRSPAIQDPTAACLSTLDLDRYPDGRMVLLKGFDERGFVFYTNLHSVKGESLKKLPRAALTFHWAPLKKQVRIQGQTNLVTNSEADAYWKTRSRLAQIGAWASQQSKILSGRAHLLKEVAKFTLRFGLKPVPRPPHWTGVRLVPRKMEFWRGRANRLHDRLLYVKKTGGWQITRLYP